MSFGIKPSAAFHGKKGKSGTKTKAVFFKDIVDSKLANRIANKKLLKIDAQEDPDLDAMKIVVMPIVVKNMVDKKDVMSGGKPLPIIDLSDVLLNNSNPKDKEVK